METRLAYCSACDRQVRVMVKPGTPETGGGEALDPASVVCLEYGSSCTGALCPLFGVPTAQMAENLERSRQEE